MASREQIVLAFDAYGTLLSTESITKQLAKHTDEETAAKLAQQWRRYQLEYTVSKMKQDCAKCSDKVFNPVATEQHE